VDIDQPLSGGSGHHQKSLSFIPALERHAADRSHEDGVAVFPVDEIGLFLVTFMLYSNQPSAKQIARHVAREA
jgi:hypothetical protein